MTVSTVPYDTISTTSLRSEPQCCCCIPLRIGCFILGYLSLTINVIHTLALLTLTTYIGISTHGFDHFDSDSPRNVNNQVPNIETVEKPILNQIGVLLMVVLCANVVWLMINIACLVGIHKRRPGPIRIYIGFATGRFMLSLAGFLYLLTTSRATTHTIISHSTDLALAGYFIFVYYIHAIQLEKELQESQLAKQQQPTEVKVQDIAIIYPPKLEKQHLVLA